MPFEEVKFEFPHESEDDNNSEIEIEESGSVEIDISGKKTEEDYKKEQEVEVEEVDDDGEVEVEEVEDDPIDVTSDDDVTEEELESYGNKVQKRINKIQKKVHAERRAKETSERERKELQAVAQRMAAENQSLREDNDRKQGALLEQAKRNTAIEVLQAKRMYKDAYESGDSEKVMEAQEKLTSAKIKADKVKNFKPEPLQAQEASVNSVDNSPAPVVDERAAKWQEANAWFGNDDEMTSYALGLHTKLVKEGLDPTSDKYYERINSRVRQLFPDNFEDAKKPKKRANVVASASRSTAPKKVRLNATQIKLAGRLGLTLEQYASQIAKESTRNV
jgi:hypothetical protein